VKISIVTTLYQSAIYLEEFHRRVTQVVRSLTDDYEIVLVNDGSPDDSQVIAQQLCDIDSRCRVLEMSRNFGHHKAIMTGLEDAAGDFVFLIDCDLEEDPAWLVSFYEELVKEDCDVVYGVQRSRKGGWFERLSGRVFYGAVDRFCDISIPRNLVTARLMRRDYVRSLVAHRDRELFLAGLWVITGYRQYPYTVVKRSNSDSTYSLARKLDILINVITSFSVRPLHMVFHLGLLIAVVTSIAAAMMVAQKLFLGGALSGWTSLIVSIWLLGGMTICCIGIVGLYVAKTFSEAKRRPYTIVRSVSGFERDGERVGRDVVEWKDAA